MHLVIYGLCLDQLLGLYHLRLILLRQERYWF